MYNMERLFREPKIRPFPGFGHTNTIVIYSL